MSEFHIRIQAQQNAVVTVYVNHIYGQQQTDDPKHQQQPNIITYNILYSYYVNIIT